MNVHEPPSIAVDLGGTIENSWESKRRWFARKRFDLGPWPRSRRDIVHTVGVDLYEEMVAEVYNDENVLRRAAVKGVSSALARLATQFRIIVVSSRNEQQRATTLQWLERRHLSAYIDDIALLGDRNKLAWCRSAGVRFFIDDDIRHLEGPGPVDTITKIHFGARRPNEHRSPAGIVVATNWQDIVDIIMTGIHPQTAMAVAVRAEP